MVRVLSFMILWEVLVLIFFTIFSQKQKLLASGVQSDSDMEELDDEVINKTFCFCL